MKLTFDNTTLDVAPNGRGYAVTLEEKTFAVEVLSSNDGRLDLLIDGQRVTAYVSSDNAKRWVTVNGQTYFLTKQAASRKSGAKHDHSGELSAPMPGQVRAVNVSQGDAVTKGQTLIVLEAMKMEIRIQSPFDGIVKSVATEAGKTVEREQILIQVDRLES